MEVQFRKKRLKKQYEDFKLAQKDYGEEVARKYVQRINIIKLSKNINELKTLPALRCHQLQGARQGQWAINLNGFYRLVFTLIDEELEIVCIEEVSKHYDD